ncbi:MAG: PIN domain-containing protein [Dehalococcoidia bacterium]|nr:PIN domain-containing protein [Dehalococcoidia bacterium]
MLVPDVNILLNAYFTRLERHDGAHVWLQRVRTGNEFVGMPNLVLSGFVRIATNPRVFPERLSADDALEFCEMLRDSSAVVRLAEGPRHWQTFSSLVGAAAVTGPDVSDAYLAAFAIENNATFVTFDRGFQRFPGLRVLEPA